MGTSKLHLDVKPSNTKKKNKKSKSKSHSNNMINPTKNYLYAIIT
jgi:hypothetical protein